jgi:PIN domain nuclease of toxin-antitoxin system
MNQTNILIDTHVLIWLANSSDIGPKALQTLQHANTIYVSAVSILELRIKQATGKLPEAENIIASIVNMNLEVLALDEHQSSNFRIFNDKNRDPFDNALVSVAIVQYLPLMTADKNILEIKYDGLGLINARQ